MVKTIRVSPQTHQRLTNLAKWGEPIEQVIIELLNEKKHSQEKIDAYLNYLLEREKAEDQVSFGLTEVIKKFKEVFL